MFSTCRIGRQRVLYNQMLPRLFSLATGCLKLVQSITADALSSEILRCAMSVLSFPSPERKSIYKIVTTGVLRDPRSPLQAELPSLMSQLLSLELACLQRGDVLTDSSLIRAMKWCLKSLQALSQSSLPAIAPLISDFASLCHTFLFSVFSDQTQIDLL